MSPNVRSASEILKDYEDQGKVVRLTEEDYERLKMNLNEELEAQQELFNHWDQESYNLALSFRFG
jgi:hypothetical protein